MEGKLSIPEAHVSTEQEEVPKVRDEEKSVKRSLGHSLKRWKTKFTQDLLNKKFFPIKILFFLLYGGKYV